MKVAQGSIGRIFVLRLEDGDRIPDCIERAAAEHGIHGAMCIMLGGIGAGRLVTGPEDGAAATITPMLQALNGVHEVAAVGTIFPNAAGVPKLHMHAAMGRGPVTTTGCVRPGVEVWKIAEVVVLELLDTGFARRLDPSLGLEVLSNA